MAAQLKFLQDGSWINYLDAIYPVGAVGFVQPKIKSSLSNIRKVIIKMILDKLRITVSGGGLV